MTDYQTKSKGKINPLPPNKLFCDYSPNNDIYVRVPYRKKNSGDYRSFVKDLGGKFDVNSERWYIPQNSLTKDIVDIVNDMNMYEGLRFARQNKVDPAVYGALKFCKGNRVFKSIQYSTHRSVHFYSFGDFEYVQLLYMSGTNSHFSEIFSQIDHIRKYCINDVLLPKDYARDEYKYYAAIQNAQIHDVPTEYVSAFFSHFKHVKIS